MNCKKCGADNFDGAKFCGRCGASLQSDFAETPENNTTENIITDNSLYGETQPFESKKQAVRKLEFAPAPKVWGETEAPAALRPQRASKLPHLIVSLFTALLAALQFFLPTADWVTYNYRVVGHDLGHGSMHLYELCKKFFMDKSVVTFLTGLNDDFMGINKFIPSSVDTKFGQGRIAALALAAVLALSLLLYFVFIVLAVFRRRAAVIVGMVAGLLNIAGCFSVLVAVDMLNSGVDKINRFISEKWINIQFNVCSAPILSIALSAVIIVFCGVMAALRSRENR